MQITNSIAVNSKNSEEIFRKFSPDFPYLFLRRILEDMTCFGIGIFYLNYFMIF